MRRIVRGLGAAGAVLALVFLVGQGSQPLAGDDKGKEAFMASKCNMCHSVPSAEIEAKVKSESMKGPDIVGVGTDADTLKKYLRKQEQIDGKDHKKEFKGTDEELDVVVSWVLAQK